MSGRWVDSFDCGPVDRTFPQTRLSRALMLLSQAYHAQEVGTGLAVDDRGLIGQASALIVTERRRLAGQLAPHERETWDQRFVDSGETDTSLIKAIDYVVTAMRLDHGARVAYLRCAEAELRSLWRAGR